MNAHLRCVYTAKLVAALLVVASVVACPRTAEAVAGVYGTILLRDLPADVIFVAGSAKTVDIPLTFFYAPMTNTSGSSACHGEGWIESTLAPVTVHSPCYGVGGCSAPPPPHGVPYHFVNALDSDGDAGPGTSYPAGFDRSKTLTLQYDGTGGPIEGSIRFYEIVGAGCSDFSTSLRLIGAMNVHIVPTSWSWPSSTFQVTSAGATGNFFYLSNPFLDGHPDAVLIATPVQEYVSISGSPATTYGGEPIGVWYNSGIGKWSIYNDSLATMTAGQRFNVTFAGYAGQRAFVHQTNTSNTWANRTYLDDPRLNSIPTETPSNGNPNARIFITHNWNPPGYTANYFPFKVGLWFDQYSQRWTIYREDLQAMPSGITFNVVVAAAPASATAYDTVGLWPIESVPGNDADRLVHFAHVWANPFTGSSGTYFNYVPVARWTHWCASPNYCIDSTVPGRHNAAASTSLYFSRWVPTNAM